MITGEAGGARRAGRVPVTNARRGGHSAARSAARVVLIHAGLILASVFMALPFIWMVLSSLKAQPEIFIFPPRWLPKRPMWSNYADVTRAMPFAQYTLNSAKVAVLVVIGQLLSASMAAYAFARLRFAGRDKLFFVWISCMMIPGQVTLIPQYLMFRRFGWLDTHLPLVVPAFFGSAFGTFLLRQFFLSIPKELEDAAVVDGCSRFQIYRDVMMPLCKPALATLAVFTFMGSWNSLLGPVIYITSSDMMTLPMGLSFFRSERFTQWALLMAGSVMSIVPIVALYIVAQRYFVQGVVLSGLKG